MIPRFKDHAANERTYLAWVRTAIAVIAFAIIIEKFSLIIHANNTVRESLSQKATVELDLDVHYITIILILMGLIMLVGATYRFIRIRAHIQSVKEEAHTPYANFILTVLIACITIVGVFYSLHVLGKLF